MNGGLILSVGSGRGIMEFVCAGVDFDLGYAL
jgi:hypothetical protein